MSNPELKKVLVGLESELRRTATALAVAQAEYEKAYTAVYEHMNSTTDGVKRMLVFSPDITVH
jgi:hypothetical protein